MYIVKFFCYLSVPFCSVIYLLAFAGCSTLAKETEPVFDVSNVKAMRLSLQDPSALHDIALVETDITEQVVGNLSEWNYVITTKEAEEYSHDLFVKIGTVELGSTPVGFSYSLGNSDPRAIDFQKTEVMPVTCIMNAKENPDLVAELSMDVDAKEILRYTKPVINQPEILELIVNKVSTVCFNLLSGLNVPTQGSEIAEKDKSPSWIPEIIVENEPEGSIDQDGSIADSPPTGAAPKSPRKRIVIKNEGTPVIFTFGHDRK